jgi:hypothetical protein
LKNMLGKFLPRMESEDKRHNQRIYGRVRLVFVARLLGMLVLTACRSQAGERPLDAAAVVTVDAAVASPVPEAAAPAVVDPLLALPPPRLCNLCGEWERQDEPYVGMRMEIRAGATQGIVTRSSTVPPGAKNKAQLECQRSLWKPGDVLVTDLDHGKGTIIVRDWGLTGGVCRHRDRKATADFIFGDENNLVLGVDVGRSGAVVTQAWYRVR